MVCTYDTPQYAAGYLNVEESSCKIWVVCVNRASKNRIKLIFALFLLVYMSALAYVCFFSEAYGRTDVVTELRYNLKPFKEIKRFLEYREIIGWRAFIINLFGNIFVFSPFGFMVPVVSRKSRVVGRIVAMTFMLSLFIEVTQLVCRVGSFDVDDLMLNTLGGLIGYIVFKIVDIAAGIRYGTNGKSKK